MSLVGSPTCTEHSEETSGAMVSTGRRRGEGRKQGNNSSSCHLMRTYGAIFRGGNTDGDSAHHSKLAANLVRDPTEDEHANDGARKSYTSERFAVIVLFDSLGI
jgi:hypothetical protein